MTNKVNIPALSWQMKGRESLQLPALTTHPSSVSSNTEHEVLSEVSCVEGSMISELPINLSGSE